MLYPTRPTNKITQSFNDGVVCIYSIINVAEAGYAPKEAFKKKGVLRFCERRLGINRYYQAMQNQIEIDRVIRVPRSDVNTQDVAIIDGRKYRVDMVQVVDGIFPACIDLTLTKIEQEAFCDEIL